MNTCAKMNCGRWRIGSGEIGCYCLREVLCSLLRQNRIGGGDGDYEVERRVMKAESGGPSSASRTNCWVFFFAEVEVSSEAESESGVTIWIFILQEFVVRIKLHVASLVVTLRKRDALYFVGIGYMLWKFFCFRSESTPKSAFMLQFRMNWTFRMFQFVFIMNCSEWFHYEFRFHNVQFFIPMLKLHNRHYHFWILLW